MFDWNTTATFTRPTNVVVQNWTTNSPTIGSIDEPAYLEVKAAGVTAGNLFVEGVDESDQAISETIFFLSSATMLSTNQYKSITALTPSWSTYTVDIKAVDVQGAPIVTEQVFGPYLCSVAADPTMSLSSNLGVPGILKGVSWRVTIAAFQPLNGDLVSTGKRYSGTVSDVAEIPIPNFPKGWVFFLTENPG